MDGLPRAAKMAEVHEVTSELSDLCFENTAVEEDTASNGHNMAQSATNTSQDSFGSLPALPSASKNRKITRHMSATLAEKARTFLEPNSQTQTTLTGNQRENERTRTSDVQENIEIFNTLAALAQHEAELSSASKPTSRRQSGNESQGGSRRESGSGAGVGGDTHLQSPRRTPSLKVGTGGQDVNNDANWNRRASARSDAAITGSSVGTLPSIEEGSVRARTRLHEDQIRKKSAPDSTKLDRTVRGDSSVNYGGDGEVGEGGVGGYTCEDAEVCLITMRGTFDPPGLAGVCVARDDSVIPRRRSSNMSDLSTEEGRRQHAIRLGRLAATPLPGSAPSDYALSTAVRVVPWAPLRISKQQWGVVTQPSIELMEMD
eukprot:comp15837_c0_seq1/m.13159 comp15837_c0_seq1/g.13159  ORF comp15837_c0_seq1/g.13159 comp15837_c0_seq1/m.13159 type:complete len:374 (-) comp15837_c0_seq1:126-1247(-)